MQKAFTTDFLTKKRKKNEGELPQYYVENSHPAIVSPETFELVQEEFRRRKAAGMKTSAISCFASRIVCGDCGGIFGRKVWHSTDKYATTIWQCNNKFTKRKFCTTPHLKEEDVKKAFVEAFNTIIRDKDELFKYYDVALSKVIDVRVQEKEIKSIEEECSRIEAIVEKLISQNAQNMIDQKEYNEKYTKYSDEFNKLQKRRHDLNSEIAMLRVKYNMMRLFVEELKTRNKIITEFDEELWCGTMNALIVKSENQVVFQFKDGTELEWTMG